MDIISKSVNLNKKKLSDIHKEGKVYKVDINDKKFVFKPAPKGSDGMPSYESCFNEIVVSCIAKEININCIQATMASYNSTNNRFKNEYGILMEDYNLDGYVPFFGSYFLEQYYNYLKANNLLKSLENVSKEEALVRMNNLKTIYSALLFFLKDFDNKATIFNGITKELVRRFCLDYLTMQNDRHMENWGILLSIDKSPILIKMYDNELSFDEDFVPQLKALDYNETKEETLINFLNTSDVFKDEFLDIYNKLDINKFESILEDIENEYGNFPSPLYKINLIKKYKKNYENIAKILEQLNIKGCDRGAR